MATIHSDADVIAAGDTGQVTGVLEHAGYRGAPPTARLRWCTSYHKRDHLNAFLVRARQGDVIGLLDFAAHRGAPPTARLRWCTGKLKAVPLDDGLRRNRLLLGERPVVLLGMRRAESPGRSRLPAMRLRKSVSTKRQKVWELFPVLDWSRRDVFRCLRDHGVEPHPAYRLLGMSDHEMYDVDAEGGARVSCVTCIFARPEHLVAAARLPEHRHLFERVVEFETATGLTWQQSRSVTGVLRRAGTLWNAPATLHGLTWNTKRGYPVLFLDKARP